MLRFGYTSASQLFRIDTTHLLHVCCIRAERALYAPYMYFVPHVYVLVYVKKLARNAYLVNLS